MNAETLTVKAILQYLTSAGYWAVRVQSGSLHHGRIHLAPKGTPDILACSKTGRFVGLEVKRTGGAHRPGQDECRSRILASRGVCEFVESVEDAACVMLGADS
jgi:hypothetical protein